MPNVRQLRARKIPAAPAPAKRKRGSPASAEIDYTSEEADLLRAAEAWKKAHRRSFLSVTEVFALVREMGYRKVEAPEAP